MKDTEPAETRSSAACYEFIVSGTPDEHWRDWFDGLDVQALPGAQTRITGQVADQAALHGVLERIRDSNMVLLAVHRLP